MFGQENYFVKIYDGDKIDLRIIDLDFHIREQSSTLIIWGKCIIT